MKIAPARLDALCAQRLAQLERLLKFDPDPDARKAAKREFLALTEPYPVTRKEAA